MKTPRTILATAALTYANGDLHLGHLLEYIQADIWVRFQRLQGHTCHFVCGSDAHGTPIMLKADAMNTTPEAWVAHNAQSQQKDLEQFLIAFDCFESTHTDANRMLSEQFYQALRENGDIQTRVIEQAFDTEKSMFLPDRFVKGRCPRCDAPDQYGDNCEACGATYQAMELRDARSVLSGNPPVAKDSEHLFFTLENYRAFLEDFLTPERVPATLLPKLKEWFSDTLRDWNISRDAPYFGFQIPDMPEKYFYVWLDAPIGYMAGFERVCDTQGLSFEEYWTPEAQTELVHFIGKDIIYFHALFWPALLKGAGFRTPSKIMSHGFLTIQGEKMSKSRGTFITAQQYLAHLPAEALRYYVASKLNAHIDDLDFHPDDFLQRINSNLVGKFVNIASRSAKILAKHFDNQLGATLDTSLYEHLIEQKDVIAEHFETGNLAKAIAEVMALTDQVNQYIDAQKPWQQVKSEDTFQKALTTCTTALNAFLVLTIYLSPVLPETHQAVETLAQTKLAWETLGTPLLTHTLAEFNPLMQRIQTAQLDALFAHV